MPLYAVLVAILMILLPVKTIIYKFCLPKEINVEDEDTWTMSYHKFGSCYHRENPLTNKVGYQTKYENELSRNPDVLMKKVIERKIETNKKTTLFDKIMEQFKVEKEKKSA